MKKDIPIHEKQIVYQIPGMDTIQVQSRIICSHPDNTELILDQYMPLGVPLSTKSPGVLLVHGGPISPNTHPLPKDWRAFVSYGQLLAASGLIALTFNHRYYGKNGEQQAGQDIEAVIEYIQTHAEELGLDKNRVCVWVFSGAGKLLPVILHRGEAVKSLVLYYTLLEFKDNTNLWDTAFAKIPICVARAGLDRANVNKGIGQFVKRAQAAKAMYELLHHPEGHHGFDILDEDERSREIIAKTLEFIQAYT